MTDLNYKRIQQFEEAERALYLALKAGGEMMEHWEIIEADNPISKAIHRIKEARQALITLESDQ